MIRVGGCSGGGGVLDASATPSLAESMVALTAAAALGGGEVKGVAARSGCVRELMRVLNLLGFRVELYSSNAAAVETAGEAAGGSVEVQCGLLVPALTAPLAAVLLPPGARLVYRSRAPDTLRSPAVKEAAAVAASLGAKAWHGETPRALLTVEGAAGRPRGLVRLYRAWGPLAAGALIAAKAATAPVRVSLLGRVRDAGWVLAAEKMLGRAQGADAATFAANGSGYTAVAAAASLLAGRGCPREWSVTVNGLQRGAAEDAARLAMSLGLEATLSCKGDRCSLRLAAGRGRPGSVIDASSSGDAVLAALVHAGAHGALVKGSELLVYEGYRLSAPAGLGLDVDVDPDSSLIEVKPSGEPPSRVECRPELLPSCFATLGLLLAAGRGAIYGGDLLEARMPGLLEAIEAIAGSIKVRA